mgnify:CR=1 FL=1
MEQLFNGVDRVTTFIGRAVGQFYFIIACITMYEVVLRYFFNKPTMWAFELAILLCGMAWILSVGYVTQQKGHISITILYLMSPPKVRWYLDLLSDVMGLVAIGILGYAAWKPAHEAISMHELSGTPFNSPEPMITKSILVVGCALYFIQLLVNTIRHLRTYGSWR